MDGKNSLTHRGFMKGTAGTLAGLGLWGTSSSWAGANERVRVAVIGIHGMGQRLGLRFLCSKTL